MLKPDQLNAFIEKPFDFVARVGLKALILEPRHVRLQMPLKGNENHIGIMYAGALFTLAEVPGGALFLTTFDITRYYPVVKEMCIQFKRPVTTDAFIEMTLTEARAQQIASDAEANGKAEFVLEGEIRNTDGDMVATSRGIYQLRRQGI